MKTIRRIKRISLFLVINLLFVSLMAQNTRTISGILNDSQGEPMPGVTISIKGTTTGTITDINGFYSIEAPVGSILIFSYVGFVPQEMLVTAESGSSQAKSNMDETENDNNEVFHHTIPDGGDKTLSPYFFVKSDDSFVDRMPLKSTTAEVNIAGVIADVTVKQLYVNEGRNTLEAIYIFPGSTKAAVYGMNMRIGNRILKAKIKEKQQARTDYETAKQEGKTATLLEQQRPNVFQMNVANILPGDTIEVTMKYTEMLESVDGIYEFVYPTVVGPRYSNTPENNAEKWIENPYLTEGSKPLNTFDIKVNLNSGIPIKKLACTTHKVLTNYSDEKTASIKLDSEEAYGGNRDFILRFGLRGGKVESGILLYEHEDENFFLLMMEPPKAPQEADITKREYIFVIDVSGSMSGFPLDVSKATMRKLLGGLNTEDKYNILTFAGGSNMLWESSQPATFTNVQYGIKNMNSQHGGGGTELLAALKRAMKVGPQPGYSRTFIVLTDGYVSFEKETFQYVRDNLNEANLFAFGLGSSCNRYLIEGLSHAGMGESFVATNQSEGEIAGEKLIDLIKYPVLTDIRIDFGDFEAYDYEPSGIPDVFAQRSILVYGKYKGSPEGTIKVKGVSGNVPYVQIFNLKNANRENTQALRYLWARNKIRYIDDFAHYYTNPSYSNSQSLTQEQVSEVTDLGLKYNLLTQYTSFIAVDSLVRNESQTLTSVKQPLPLPKGVSNAAVANVQNVQALTNTGSISLTEDVLSLTEVLVVGYGTQMKSSVTGSIASVSSDNFTTTTNMSVASTIQGRAAGVQIVNNSGAPGTGTSIRIRGNNSLSSGNQPLYIVDGVPVQAGDFDQDPLLSVNPDDIESIEILKDAAASSIYGNRAGNGVIIINTKEGAFGKHKVNFKAQAGIKKADLPQSLISESNLWYKDLVEPASTQKYALNYSSGSNKYTVKFNAGYNNDAGVIQNTGLKNYTASNVFNLIMFRNYLSISGNVKGNYANIKSVAPYKGSSLDNLIETNSTECQLLGNLNAELKLPVDGLYLFGNYGKNYRENNYKITLEEDAEIYQKYGYSKYSAGIKYSLSTGIHNLNFIADFENNYEHNYLKQNTKSTENSSQSLSQKVNMNTFFSSLKYDIRNRYYTSIIYRVEKSPEFATGEWNHLPYVSLGWKISDENFMNAVGAITNFKVRYSIGTNSKPMLPMFMTFNPVYYSLFGLSDEVPEISTSPGLSMEKNGKQNLGIDLGLFSNRLSIRADYFRHITKEMYFLNCVNETSYEWINAGDYVSKGFDANIETFLPFLYSLKLRINSNIGFYRTEITELDVATSGGIYRNIGGVLTGQELKTGEPLGLYYGYRVQNIDKENQVLMLADVNKDGVINELDREPLVNTNPKIYGGFGFELEFGKFDLSALFNYTYGNQAINLSTFQEYCGYEVSELTTGNSDGILTDLSVEEASYLRLSDLSLVYEFSSRSIKRLGIEKLSLGITGLNLLTLTNYKGQDPEFNNWNLIEQSKAQTLPGIDKNYYPVSRGIQMVLELKF